MNNYWIILKNLLKNKNTTIFYVKTTMCYTEMEKKN